MITYDCNLNRGLLEKHNVFLVDSNLPEITYFIIKHRNHILKTNSSYFFSVICSNYILKFYTLNTFIFSLSF